ncbi:MAG TPA: GNAT family N-acetyltransferase [Alphaproteobacteria bacterium]|nr:GNAT family N-acetyltransferase [Alphaproteobacteria bacterium]
MEDVKIRAARPADGDAVARMAAELSAHEGMPAPDFTADGFSAEGFGPDAAFATVIAERDGKPIGYALYYGGYDVQTGSRGRHVADLYVAFGHRGQGIGRALLAAVARAGKAQGAAWLVLQVNRHNEMGEAFYRALGGKEDRDRVYVFDGEVFLTLATGPG